MPDITNFVNAFENFGRFLFNSIQDVSSVYFATFIFLTFLIYAIVLAIIGRVPGLGDTNKANRYGKVVAFVIAIISTISIYYLGKGNDMESVIRRVLPMYGIFGGAIIAILFFGIIYFGFSKKEEGRWQLALLGSGFLMAVVGYFITSPQTQSIGWVIGVIGLILYISSAGLIEESTKAIKGDK